MGAFNPQEYDTVATRITRFYNDNPNARIITKIVSNDGTTVVVKALLFRDESDVVWATGYAEEVRGEGFVNKTSPLENCETSAIGRALANANYSGDKRASREEMEKVERMQAVPPKVESTKVTPEDIKNCASLIKDKLGDISEEETKSIMLKVAGIESLNDLTKESVKKLAKDLALVTKDALEMLKESEVVEIDVDKIEFDK